MTGYEYNHINDVLEDLYECGKLTEKDFEFLCAITDKADRCDKYAWHDLRKNPNDLPKKYDDVFITDGRWYGIGDLLKIEATGEIIWEDENGYCFDTAVAWKKIEPFEEVE